MAGMKRQKWELDEGKFLTKNEVKKLRRICRRRSKLYKVGVRDFLIIDLGLYCGLRVQEIADLKVGDILISDERSSLIVRNGKGGKRRFVRFNGEFKRHLKDYYLAWKVANKEGIEDKDPLIVSSNTGGHLSKRAVQRAFERCARLAGIAGHSSHHLRHTYASHFYKATGYNLRAVQKQLGHSNVKTTQIYADVFNEDVEIALEKLYMN